MPDEKQQTQPRMMLSAERHCFFQYPRHVPRKPLPLLDLGDTRRRLWQLAVLQLARPSIEERSF